jgi:hypothetical protein
VSECLLFYLGYCMYILIHTRIIRKLRCIHDDCVLVCDNIMTVTLNQFWFPNVQIQRQRKTVYVAVYIHLNTAANKICFFMCIMFVVFCAKLRSWKSQSVGCDMTAVNLKIKLMLDFRFSWQWLWRILSIMMLCHVI